MSDLNKYKWLVFAPLGFSLILGLLILVSIIFHDVAFYNMYAVANGMTTTANMPIAFVNMLEGVINLFVDFINSIDFIWGISFIILVGLFLRECYLAKRESYFSFFATVTFILLFVVFISSIVASLGSSFWNFITQDAITYSSLNIRYFPFYLSNAPLINGLVLVFGAVINILDLDFSTFSGRKEKEVINDEI